MMNSYTHRYSLTAAEKGGFENYEICVCATHKAARTIMECSITQMSNNRQSAAAENSRPGVEKAPCLLNKRNRMPLADILFFYLAEKGGFGRRLASQFPRMPCLCQRHPGQNIDVGLSTKANNNELTSLHLC